MGSHDVNVMKMSSQVHNCREIGSCLTQQVLAQQKVGSARKLHKSCNVFRVSQIGSPTTNVYSYV